MKIRNLDTSLGIPSSLLTRHLYFILFILVLVPLQSNAYVADKGRITASTGPYVLYTDMQSKPQDFFDQPRFGFGLVAEGTFAKNQALEIGLYYMEKPYLRAEGPNILIQQIKRMHITTGYRYWWNKYVSSGVGIFSAFSIGDPKDVSRSSGLPTDYATSAEVVTVYGLDASLRFEFDITKKDGIFIDTRYALHFKPEGGERPNHLMFGIFYSRQVDVK